MPKSDDEAKSSTGQINRRAVIGGVLAVGGLSAFGAPIPHPGSTPSAEAVVAEREWARTLARNVANQLPEAARQIPGICLSDDQIEQLRQVFENTLVINMGCGVPPGQST